MTPILKVESTLTDRYQTTVPDAVRQVLGLGKRDRIAYTIQPDGSVMMKRSVPEDDDPVLGAFLGFLANDIKAHPEHVQMLDARLVARVEALVGDIEIDLDAPLPADES